MEENDAVFKPLFWCSIFFLLKLDSLSEIEHFVFMIIYRGGGYLSKAIYTEKRRVNRLDEQEGGDACSEQGKTKKKERKEKWMMLDLQCCFFELAVRRWLYVCVYVCVCVCVSVSKCCALCVVNAVAGVGFGLGRAAVIEATAAESA